MYARCAATEPILPAAAGNLDHDFGRPPDRASDLLDLGGGKPAARGSRPGACVREEIEERLAVRGQSK